MLWKQNGYLNPPYPLTNFEIHKYYQNESRFNGVYSRENLPERSSTEIKDGAYIINLDEYILILELIGLFCTQIIIVLLISIVLG